MSQHNDQLPDDWTRRARPKLHSVIYGSLKGCLDDATVNLVVSYCIPKRTYISCGIYYLPSVLDVYEDWKVDPYLQLPIGNLQHMNRNRFHTHFGVLVPNLDDISITDLYIKITHKQSKASGRYYTQCHGLYLVMNKVRCLSFLFGCSIASIDLGALLIQRDSKLGDSIYSF